MRGTVNSYAQIRVRFDVPGSARKALANAIGDYPLDCRDILTGPHSACLLGFPAPDG